MIRAPICLLLTGVGLFGSALARADDYVPDGDDKYSYAWTDKRLISGIGIGVSLEGGVGGFTDGDNRGQGVWGLRMTFGTHTPLALDAAYVGTINSIDSLTDDNADLIGTALEGALRWNILPHYKWNPYIFGGVGWQNYNVNNVDFVQADTGIGDGDNLAVFPMGAGVAYRDKSGLTIDVRGTLRLAQSTDFIVDVDGNNVNLSTWEANAALGYEF
jgi:hypothetical protein